MNVSGKHSSNHSQPEENMYTTIETAARYQIADRTAASRRSYVSSERALVRRRRAATLHHLVDRITGNDA